MKTLLVVTTGQTDVQLVANGERHKLDSNACGTLHNAIRERSWSLIDSPRERNPKPIKELPDGTLLLCTPKLDAVLAHFTTTLPTAALIFETKRQDARDPNMAGEVMERRLRERGIQDVTRVAFLTGVEQLEDPSNEVDAVVRRSIVQKLASAVARATEGLKRDDRVFVATTGGLPAANEVINELVRLHCVGGPEVTALDVPDGDRAKHGDRAIEEKFHPAVGYRGRWQALSLIDKGNLLAARGAVSHLEGEPGQDWTQVVECLACFASSLPLPADCDFPGLNHRLMAVRSALRVEFALRAGDVPRAVHGTVAFFESAIWDHLLAKFVRIRTETGGMDSLRLKPGVQPPTGKKLLRNDSEPNDAKNCPFEVYPDGTYRFFESGAGRLAKYYLECQALKLLADATVKVRHLRNDVAHNEPTPKLMSTASQKMREHNLWSASNGFLCQPLVNEVLGELNAEDIQELFAQLRKEVHRRIMAV